MKFEPEREFETLLPEQQILISGAIDVIRLDVPPAKDAQTQLGHSQTTTTLGRIHDPTSRASAGSGRKTFRIGDEW
jgi:hypothetical protein